MSNISWLGWVGAISQFCPMSMCYYHYFFSQLSKAILFIENGRYDSITPPIASIQQFAVE